MAYHPIIALIFVSLSPSTESRLFGNRSSLQSKKTSMRIKYFVQLSTGLGARNITLRENYRQLQSVLWLDIILPILLVSIAPYINHLSMCSSAPFGHSIALHIINSGCFQQQNYKPLMCLSTQYISCSQQATTWLYENSNKFH